MQKFNQSYSYIKAQNKKATIKNIITQSFIVILFTILAIFGAILPQMLIK